MRVLCTGGSGYIGSLLCNALHADNYDIKQSPNEDILIADRVDEAIKTHDIVYHLASPVIVQDSIENPYYYWKTIVDGTKNVVDACLRYNCRLIFTSTQLVENRWRCKTCGKLQSPYAEAKLEAEKLIQKHMDNYLIVRLPNVYDLEDQDPNKSRLVPRLRSAARLGTINIYPPTTDTIELLTLQQTVQKLTSYLTDGVGVCRVHGEKTTIGELANKIAQPFNAKVVVTDKSEILKELHG